MRSFQVLGTQISCKVTPIFGFTHIVESFRDREVACSSSDRQSFESCV